MKNYEKAYKDYQKGMSYKKMADKYGVSINTVKSWKTKQWKRMEEEAHKVAQKHTRKSPTYSAEELERRRNQAVENGKSYMDEVKKTSKHIKEMRELTEVVKAGRPPAYTFKDTGKMIQRITDYFIICDEKRKPYTRAGIIRALGINKDTYYRYLGGDFDYLLEEHIRVNDIDINECEVMIGEDGTEIRFDGGGNPLISYSEILQKALLRIEEQSEERLYFKGRPGDIFTMKQYGWADEKTAGTVNNTLVIASSEEADKALKMLYGK